QLDGDATRLPAADALLPERVRRLEREYLQIQRQLQLGVAGRREMTEVGGRRTEASSPPSSVLRPPSPSTPSNLRASDLQAMLGEDEQIVEYVTVRDEVVAFVVDRKRFRTVQGLAS